MLGSALAFTVEASLIHRLGPEWPAPFIFFWRQLFGLFAVLPLLMVLPWGSWAARRPAVMLFRSASGCVAVLLSIHAIATLPLAVANGISFTRPLWIALIAWFVLRERIDRRTAVALACGLAGMLMILRPSDAGLDAVGVAAAAAAAILFAASLVSIRAMAASDPPFAILTWGLILGLAFSVPFAVSLWQTPAWSDLAMLAAVGIVSNATNLCTIKALSLAPAAQVAPFDYLRLPLALGVGAIAFGEMPGWLLVSGCLLIVLGAAMTTLRRA